jgi:hypothetical protein
MTGDMTTLPDPNNPSGNVGSEQLENHPMSIASQPVQQNHADVPVLRPLMPLAETLLPYLRRIDASRGYTNYGPLVLEFGEHIARMLPLPANDVATASSGTTTLAGATLTVTGAPHAPVLTRSSQPTPMSRRQWRSSRSAISPALQISTAQVAPTLIGLPMAVDLTSAQIARVIAVLAVTARRFD